jgi:putative membrane-bound dehydrogenase-like protein
VNRLILALVLFHSGIEAVVGQSVTDPSGDLDALPIVPPGFMVEFAAREPLVRNPCAVAFDFAGRLFVGMGPQYRTPKPDTPGDSVFIMVDDDGDGRFDSKKQFATGFNSIQSIAWRGRDLWIANAPDLTVVRDLDGDDVADEYVRVFTDLGNLEHGLHGLNWGPDGRLYMSKGNSKGLSQPGRIAPKPFRELWGVTAPEGSPDFPPPQKFSPEDYKHAYHDPIDDWGREGGVLVCDDMGKNLEIVSRGFRNPWDIAFDSGFNWQGTDNDQNDGDRVFMPFFGSHFGWGHPWSAHWTGKDHPPTAPITGPVFHGSGTGIVFYDAKQFPEKYRGVWFFNDWLRRTVFFYRPVWEGALIQPEGGRWQEFITGGNSLFKPTDIEVGPDGSLYILGWGRAYGAEFDKDGEQSNEGRIFRVSWKDAPAFKEDPKFGRPLKEWTHDELVAEFDSPIPARRIGAQDELLRRGSSQVSRDAEKVRQAIFFSFRRSRLDRSQETWTLWTLGRLNITDPNADRDISGIARLGDYNTRTQALRILAHRVRTSPKWRPFPDEILPSLRDLESRIRMAAALALRRGRQTRFHDPLLHAVSLETDPVVFYSQWQTLRELVSSEDRHKLLSDPRPLVRRAALLSLAEDRDLKDDEVTLLLGDEDDQTRQVAALWLTKKSGNPLLMVDPPPGKFQGGIAVRALSAIKPSDVRVTTDGSEPTLNSRRWNAAIGIMKTTTIRAAVFVDGRRVGPIATLPYRRLTTAETAARSGIVAVDAASGRGYRVVEGGVSSGNPVYTDRAYAFEAVPSELAGSLMIRTPNDDSGSSGDDFLKIETVLPMTLLLGVDTRIADRPNWLADPRRSFSATDLQIRTNDATFRIYSRSFDAGEITLGGNTDDSSPSGKSNYLVILKPDGLPKLAELATLEQVLPLVPKADPARGKAIFLANAGVGCSKCHRADGEGKSFGPDLAHLVQKRDPIHIVKSILEPSAEIKEGFATLTIVTTAGKTISGLRREETSQFVTLARAERRDLVIPIARINDMFSRKVSAMPDVKSLLKPQDVADVTAWLLSRKVGKEPEVSDAPPGPSDSAAQSENQTVGSTGPDSDDPDRAQFSFDRKKDRLLVKLNGADFATYLHGHKELPRPAWIDVYSPSGVRMTRNFPPRSPEDDGAGDHKFMHPGIWISFGHLDGEDYWRLTSRTQHVKFAEKPYSKPGRAGFTVRNRYLRRDGKSVVCEELTKYTLMARPEGVLMLVEASFQSDRHDFYFGDQEESGLAFRMESKLKVEGGTGTILNSHGDKNGAAAWGQEAAWVDYFATAAGHRVGIMVVPGPGNARRCWMHTRDYGLVAVNPFPKQPKERREPYIKTVVRKGEPYRLSYGVLIHDAPAEDMLDRKQVYEEVTKRLKTEVSVK